MCIMDHHRQEMSSQTLESILVSTKPEQEKKPTRPSEQEPQKCPRCDSANTKFCYYNNYSLSQPRYFCKSCRRYWTKGGTLRNVPVGGGCRKNKRSSTSSSKRSTQDDNNNPLTLPISSPFDSTTDLSLAFASLQKQTNTNGHYLGIDQEHNNNNNNMALMFKSWGMGQFIENTPNHGLFHNNMYYGNMGQFIENGDLGMSYDNQEMGIGTSTIMTTTTTTTSVKQEMCDMARSSEGHDLNNNNNNNGKVLWGFPWQQLNGDHNMSDFYFESTTNRQSWNGFGGSSNWHGLLNSPLM